MGWYYLKDEVPVLNLLSDAFMEYSVYITDLLDAFESNEVNNQD